MCMPSQNQVAATRDFFEIGRRMKKHNLVGGRRDASESGLQVGEAKNRIIQSDDPDTRADLAGRILQEVHFRDFTEPLFVSDAPEMFPVASHEPNSQRCMESPQNLQTSCIPIVIGLFPEVRPESAASYLWRCDRCSWKGAK